MKNAATAPIIIPAVVSQNAHCSKLSDWAMKMVFNIQRFVCCHLNAISTKKRVNETNFQD